MDLRALEPLYSKIPDVAPPERPLSLKEKLLWTGVALVLFYIMGFIRPIGVEPHAIQTLEFFQVVLASNIGSILSAGIGPIVVASIILQLFVGSGIISVDLSDPAQRRAFMGTQKLLAIFFAIFEGFVFTNSLVPAVPGLGWLVALQIALGSIALMYLDEIVMKWGIGSGISLFIAAGVSKSMFWRAFRIPDGVVWDLFYKASMGDPYLLVNLFMILNTIIIFLIVVYVQGIHVDIPITFARVRGAGGRYPVRLLYLANIPVILAAALFANIQLWAYLAKDTPIGPILGVFENVEGRSELVGGLAYFTKPPRNLLLDILRGVIEGVPPADFGFRILHAVVYMILLTLTSIFFGMLWLDISGAGPKDVARQLVQSGFTIPGFRRDPRVVEKVLEKYIPAVAFLGSAFVGIVAAFTDVFGALASGMGILLATTIVYRYYEILMREKLFELYPQLRRFVG